MTVCLAGCLEHVWSLSPKQIGTRNIQRTTKKVNHVRIKTIESIDLLHYNISKMECTKQIEKKINALHCIEEYIPWIHQNQASSSKKVPNPISILVWSFLCRLFRLLLIFLYLLTFVSILFWCVCGKAPHLLRFICLVNATKKVTHVCVTYDNRLTGQSLTMYLIEFMKTNIFGTMVITISTSSNQILWED